MSVSPGDRLGPYELLSSLGVGAMGEVYRARDTCLARDVAVKVIAGDSTPSPDRLHRFEQEAKAHPALDDGGVQSTGGTTSEITGAGTVLGTVGYMSPEQVKGVRADSRSDIFSFGCVLYEMLTRRRAFHGETAAETMTAILHEDPPD